MQSGRPARAKKALEVQYEEYYEQLADQQSLSPEEQAALRSGDVTREVEMLEDASSCLRQAHQCWASDKADELTTRLREGRRELPRRASSAVPPPTPLSTWRRSRRIALPPASTFKVL